MMVLLGLLGACDTHEKNGSTLYTPTPEDEDEGCTPYPDYPQEGDLIYSALLFGEGASVEVTPHDNDGEYKISVDAPFEIEGGCGEGLVVESLRVGYFFPNAENKVVPLSVEVWTSLVLVRTQVSSMEEGGYLGGYSFQGEVQLPARTLLPGEHAIAASRAVFAATDTDIESMSVMLWLTVVDKKSETTYSLGVSMGTKPKPF